MIQPVELNEKPGGASAWRRHRMCLSAMVGMAPCGVPARAVAGGANIGATVAFGELRRRTRREAHARWDIREPQPGSVPKPNVVPLLRDYVRVGVPAQRQLQRGCGYLRARVDHCLSCGFAHRRSTGRGTQPRWG